MSPSSKPLYHPKQPQEDDPYVLERREKARERQRRKRARDKSATALASFLESHPDANMDPKERELAMQASGINKRVGNGRGIDLDTLPPGEAARREKIRIAARERQRRHRAGVKAKRMAELGMAIVNAGGRVEQTAIGYTINENGQYEAVLADANQNPPPGPYSVPHPHPHPHVTPGQTFSSTLFLALSCAPLLKQHLLRTLRSTNEELAAFEPVIATAFDHWDHSRAMYYATHGYHAASSSYLPSAAPYPQSHDFRDRPYRTLVPPMPLLKSQKDVDESVSASDESHRSDEDEQGGTPSERTQSVRDETRATVEEREKDDQKQKAEVNGPETAGEVGQDVRREY